MKKILAVVLAGMLIFATACGEEKDSSKQDIAEPKVNGRVTPEDYEARVPQVLTIYRNVDGHPTINKLCIEGIAFRTISTTHSKGDSVVRVPEWDDTCPGFKPERTQYPTNSGGRIIVEESNGEG